MMRMRGLRAVSVLSTGAALSLSLIALLPACEQNYLDPMLAKDGSASDALVCPFCADVSADAVFYDSAEASVYAVPPRAEPGDAGTADGGAAQDALASEDATVHDSG